MKFAIENLDNGIRLVKLTGRLDVQGTNEIDNSFTFAVSSSKSPTLVDMSEVEFLASIGMRMLISSARAVSRRGGKFALLNPTPLVRESLVTAGFEELLPMYDDFDVACNALQTVATE